VGVKHDLSARWGLRADIRGHLGRRTDTNRIDAVPTVAHQQPPTLYGILWPSGQAFQWVNFDHPQFRSTLNGTVRGFETYRGTATDLRLAATVGVYMRF
jgi:hypothetical protein